MSKKRPGVQAGMNLIQQLDREMWKRVELQYAIVRDAIPRLAEYNANLQAMNMTAKNKEENNPTCVRASDATANDTTTNTRGCSFNKQQLLNIIQWKHSVGKNRVYNFKLINSNTDDKVGECSKKAVNCSRIIIHDASSSNNNNNKNTFIQEAMEHLTVLRGVGPATASAFLCLVRPDIFCYMYDEVIDCFENKRDYKMVQYLRVNDHCHDIAQKLDWTTARVAKAIWTACRYFAITGQDLTEPLSKLTDNADNVKSNDKMNDKENDDENSNKKPRAKRKRRQR